jgi:hypothetical protein
MAIIKQVVHITDEEWHAQVQRGVTAVVDDRRYLVTPDRTTNEPVYQPVMIIAARPVW